MCESSLSLSGSITHPVWLPGLYPPTLSHPLSLSSSPITHWVSPPALTCSLTPLSQSYMIISCNTLSLSFSSSLRSLPFSLPPSLFLTFSLSLLNIFEIHFWHGIMLWVMPVPPFLFCISSKSHHSSPSLCWVVVWRPAWLTAGRMMDMGWDPVNCTPLQHSTTETRHYCITLRWIQNDMEWRVIDKTELNWKGMINNTAVGWGEFRSLSSLCSWAKINSAAYQGKLKLTLYIITEIWINAKLSTYDENR